MFWINWLIDDWLIDWLIDDWSMIDWSMIIDWLIDWFIGTLLDCLLIRRKNEKYLGFGVSSGAGQGRRAAAQVQAVHWSID